MTYRKFKEGSRMRKFALTWLTRRPLRQHRRFLIKTEIVLNDNGSPDYILTWILGIPVYKKWYNDLNGIPLRKEKKITR